MIEQEPIVDLVQVMDVIHYVNHMAHQHSRAQLASRIGLLDLLLQQPGNHKEFVMKCLFCFDQVCFDQTYR